MQSMIYESIAKNFRGGGGNFCVSVQNENFEKKPFPHCSGPIIVWVWPQKFAEKTLTDGSETAKKEKVFSLARVLLLRCLNVGTLHYLLKAKVIYTPPRE